MANVFDQFDTPATPQAAASNPFDQFDPPKAPEWKPDLATAGHALGLDARSVIQGAAAIPNIALNAAGGAYNGIADMFQGYHAPQPSNAPNPAEPFRFRDMNQNVSDLLTRAGLPVPATTGERLGGAAVSGMAGAGGGLGIAQGLKAIQAPAAQAVGRVMAANPFKQMFGGGTGGAAAQGAQEAGLPVPAQMAAGLAGGMVPFGGELAGAAVRGGPLTAAEQRASSAGFAIPPATMDKPSVLSQLLGGWSGKIKSQQAASVQNQALTKQIAASSLGLPRDTLLDDNAFNSVRAPAGQAYEAVKQAVPTIQTDPQFIQQVSGLGSLNSDVATHFPDLVKNDAISGLATSLAGKQDFPTGAGVEIVKILRQNGTKNLQAIGDPEKNALGFAQRDAANAIDDLMDRNISAAGNPGIIDQYRAARQLIAKSHDVESATNTSTGEVDPSRLAMMANKGKPLSGGLAQIADVANAFPKAMQMPSKFGGAEPLSVLDIMAAGAPMVGGAMSGRPLEGAGLGAAILSRPLARAATLSAPYQAALRNRAPLGAIGLLPNQLGIDSNIFRNNQ